MEGLAFGRGQVSSFVVTRMDKAMGTDSDSCRNLVVGRRSNFLLENCYFLNEVGVKATSKSGEEWEEI